MHSVMRSVLALSVLLADALVAGAAIDDCLSQAKVPVDAKGSTDWNQDAAPFNRRLAYTPAAIAVPKTLQDIQNAVTCGAKTGVKVSAKSGGHSYASFGLGGENGHLVIELDRMYDVKLDSSTNIATIQSGARLGHVATALFNQGKRAFSHGTCPGVGIAGHSLHGGFGFSSHTHGLALDWMEGATVVLANGTAVNTSATENPDLFWALRGAGSSFGVVSSFRFRTFAAPSQVTVFSINLPWKNTASCVSGWSSVQDYLINSMPAELNMRVFANNQQMQLQGLYHGSSSGLQSAISSLTSKLGAGLSQTQTQGWMQAFTYYTYGGTVDTTHPYNTQETFFSKSMMTTELPRNAMQAVCDYWTGTARSVSRDWFIIIDMYGGKNGKIPSVASNAMSYAYRDKFLYMYELYDRVPSGSYPANGLSFLNGWADAFTKNLNESQWGMYINYADPTMNRTYAQKVYYRQSLDKLQQLKAQFDPTDVFYYPQGIEPKK